MNAIEQAALLVVYLQSLSDRFAQTGPFDEDFDIPFSTLQTGVIKGGIAVNTVPAECELTFEFRNVPSMSAESIKSEIETYIAQNILPGMRRRNSACQMNIDWLAEVPAFEADENTSFKNMVHSILGTGSAAKVAYGTEAGYFAQACIPTVVCGPGDISQAHTADEFVSLEQLARCEKFLNALLDEA